MLSTPQFFVSLLDLHWMAQREYALWVAHLLPILIHRLIGQLCCCKCWNEDATFEGCYVMGSLHFRSHYHLWNDAFCLIQQCLQLRTWVVGWLMVSVEWWALTWIAWWLMFTVEWWTPTTIYSQLCSYMSRVLSHYLAQIMNHWCKYLI
jgi:hypothetical protein